MNAILFDLTSLETGAPRGQALVCPEVHYASLRWIGQQNLIRCHGTQTRWDEVLGQVALGFEPGPLSDDSPIVKLLEVPADIVVQYLGTDPFEAYPESLAAQLDTRLAQ